MPTNPNRTATVRTIAFEELKPGDKFALPNSYMDVVGVCVRAPEVHETKRRIFRSPLVTYTARCIELHQYLGACEWNPKELAGTTVDLLEPPRS